MTGRLLGTSSQIAAAMAIMQPFGVEALAAEEDVQNADDWSLAIAREQQKAIIDAAHDAVLAAGITPQGSQITLGAQVTDQNAFTRMAGLIREAELPDNYPQTITDQNGAKHDLTVGTLRTLLVAYGAAIQALFNLRADKRTAIDAAQSAEAVRDITWS